MKVSISSERKSKLGQIQSKEILKEQLYKNLKCVHDSDVLKRNQIGNDISNFGDVNNETKKKMIKKMVKICLKIKETV